MYSIFLLNIGFEPSSCCSNITPQYLKELSHDMGRLIIVYKQNNNNKHNAELQRADPGTKDMGNLVPGPRVIFSHTMPKMDFYYSHRFSWEKAH